MTIDLFASGRVSALPSTVYRALCERQLADGDNVRAIVERIIGRVRQDGDAALIDYAREYDGASITALEVPRARWDAAVERIDPDLRRSLERAARNIGDVHAAFAPQASEFTTSDGVRIGRRPDPLARVGVYAPGGRAAYPSSVLMGVVPARTAGVRDIVVCSPPGRDGIPSEVVLAAAAVGGATRVFAIGGAGAIAAMAFGTASVPRVDRIVGPGNAFVTEAKTQVAHAVGIDLPAGPSELLVLADNSADPEYVADELLAQAEHDPRASVVLVALDDAWLAQAVAVLSARLDASPRADVIRTALQTGGAALVADHADHAVAFAADYAAEHLLLAVADPEQWLPRIRNAGSVFLGRGASVAFGDYLSGANHVLPTGGLARSYSGLSPLEFVRWTTYQHFDERAAARLSGDTVLLALAEGLPAHAAAAGRWKDS